MAPLYLPMQSRPTQWRHALFLRLPTLCASPHSPPPFSLARHPPDISKVQDDEVGDGTTSVVVLAGELLREAEQLVNQKIHPMTIIAGFREACECAREVLAASAFR